MTESVRSHAIALFGSTLIKRRISVVIWEIPSHRSLRAGFDPTERYQIACVGRSWFSTAFDVETMTRFSCGRDASYLYSSPDFSTDKEPVTKQGQSGRRRTKAEPPSDAGAGSQVRSDSKAANVLSVSRCGHMQPAGRPPRQSGASDRPPRLPHTSVSGAL